MSCSYSSLIERHPSPYDGRIDVSRDSFTNLFNKLRNPLVNRIGKRLACVVDQSRNKKEGDRPIFKMSCEATYYNGDVTPSAYTCIIDSSDYIGEYDRWSEPVPGGEMDIRTRRFDLSSIADQNFVREFASALQSLGGSYERSESETRATDDSGTVRYDYFFSINCPSEVSCIFQVQNSVKPELGN